LRPGERIMCKLKNNDASSGVAVGV
jgi:hypothetical protein